MLLTLSQLEAFDPRAPGKAGSQRRFLCPLCGEAKPRDSAHRSLSANLQNGAWTCFRCGATGKLKEFWTDPLPPLRVGLPPITHEPTRVRNELRRQLVQQLAGWCANMCAPTSRFTSIEP